MSAWERPGGLDLHALFERGAVDGTGLRVQPGGIKHDVDALVLEGRVVVQVGQQAQARVHQRLRVEVFAAHHEVVVAPARRVVDAGAEDPHPRRRAEATPHTGAQQLDLVWAQTHGVGARRSLGPAQSLPSNGIAPSPRMPSSPVRV
jgi:hypothetical protein